MYMTGGTLPVGSIKWWLEYFYKHIYIHVEGKGRTLRISKPAKDATTNINFYPRTIFRLMGPHPVISGPRVSNKFKAMVSGTLQGTTKYGKVGAYFWELRWWLDWH